MLTTAWTWNGSASKDIYRVEPCMIPKHAPTTLGMAPSSFPSMTKSSTESSLMYRPLVPLTSSCMFRRYWSRSICARKPWGWRYKMVSSIFCVDEYVHVDTCLINPPPLQKSTFHHVTMSQLLEMRAKGQWRPSETAKVLRNMPPRCCICASYCSEF